MLVDYFENMPWIIVWLDWNFHAHKASLIILLVGMTILFLFRQSDYISFSGWTLSMFIGFCMWCVFLYFEKYGFAVG